MNINTCIALVLAPIVNSVLFGAGVVAIVSIPELKDQQMLYLLEWAAVSLWATPVIALTLAPPSTLRGLS